MMVGDVVVNFASYDGRRCGCICCRIMMVGDVVVNVASYGHNIKCCYSYGRKVMMLSKCLIYGCKCCFSYGRKC